MNANDQPTNAAENPQQTPSNTTPEPGPAPTPSPTPVPEAPKAAEPAKKTTELSAEVEAEIAQAMKEMDEASGAAPKAGDAGAKTIRGPRVVQGGREHRKGVVVSVGPDDIFIEFGPKELGVAPKAPFMTDGGEPPATGSTIEVVVERFDSGEGLFVCNKPGAVVKAEWEMLEPGQVVEARVTGTNKGGLEMEVANHRAFMPASHVDTRRIEDLSVFVGEKMPCKVIRVDRMGRGNITLSRRDLIKEEQKEQASKLQESLKEGDTIKGKVNKIMPFGAFVDMGGIDGLLHISDLAHDRVNKVEDVVKEGQEVEVRILKLDWDKGRHSLGLKQLLADPFEEATKSFAEGEDVTGTVTKLLDFGAFVEIAPGVEGLVHISELDWKRVEKTSDVVQPGKVVQVKVLKIEPDNRKISLSIKQTKERPAAPKGSGPRGRGKGREQDTRSAEEILKETPQLRRLREQAKQKNKGESKSGLGDAGGLGVGLGDLGKFLND
ncbi:MAG: S1 RNA-binding domain-containing protein [Phycisphaerales bacterium]